MTTSDILSALESAVAELPDGLRDHIRRVVAEVTRLARRHQIDADRALLATLGHDLARPESPDELLRRADAAGLDPNDAERAAPILLHGPLSSRMMAERFAIDDAEVLAAARYHTTARAGMGALERLIYVADKIEPVKMRGEPDLVDARRLADESLEAAMLPLLDLHIARAVERGWPLHPDTLAARNEALAAR